MFDKLVESGARGNRGRTGRYFIGASLVYALGLLSVAIATVMWFNPGMAEAFELTSHLVPPPIPIAPQRTITAPRNTSSGGGNPNSFVAPRTFTVPTQNSEQPPVISDPAPVRGAGPVISNIPNSAFSGPIGGNKGTAQPPPPPTPTPTPQPSPTATVVNTQRVSERVLQGNAINRVTPPYPDIAKRAHIQGSVQVLVTISEEGRVIEANVVSG